MTDGDEEVMHWRRTTLHKNARVSLRSVHGLLRLGERVCQNFLLSREPIVLSFTTR